MLLSIQCNVNRIDVVVVAAVIVIGVPVIAVVVKLVELLL